MDQQMTAPTGRPTAYTLEIADAICEGIADGNSLRSICDSEDMPAKSTVFSWLADDRYEAFRTKYARAREAQADALFDDMIDIADDARNDWMEKRNAEGENIGWMENGEALRRSDIRIKTRQWMASKLRPKKYGDKLELSGDPDNPVHTVTRIELVAPDHGDSED